MVLVCIRSVYICPLAYIFLSFRRRRNLPNIALQPNRSLLRRDDSSIETLVIAAAVLITIHFLRLQILLYAFKIVSMAANSSLLNSRFFKQSTESSNCAGLLAPMSTDVTRSSFNSQAKAICAND